MASCYCVYSVLKKADLKLVEFVNPWLEGYGLSRAVAKSNCMVCSPRVHTYVPDMCFLSVSDSP